MAETRFEYCLAEVLRHEGGYVDHPSDPGGATNMGITRKTLARWRRITPWADLPKHEVERLTRDEMAAIYRTLYWDAVDADQMPAGIDLALFDFAVNSGPDRAVRLLQSVLDVAADGVVGPVTIAAAKAGEPRAVINGLCDRRLGFLGKLRTFATFGRGWTRRVAAIRAAALAMNTPTSPVQGSTPMDFLSGYKTYIVAALMLLAGLAQVMGIELPSLDGAAAGNLVLEALAIIFLRKGIKKEEGSNA